MEQYILKKLDMELSGEDYLDFIKSLMIRAKSQKKKDNTLYFYYPIDTIGEDKIEFISEGEIVRNEVILKEFYIHHTSKEIWEGKLENLHGAIYVLKKDGMESIVTVVNDKLMENKDNVKLQVAAFGHSLEIFETEEKYLESLKETNAMQVANGAILPLVYLNKVLDQKEKDDLDRVVTIRGQIVSLKEIEIDVFGIKAGTYILAKVRTGLGELPVYFKPNSIEGKMPETIKEGDILVGNVSITCNYQDK